MIEVGKTGITIPDGEIEWRFTPSGGPGGQHANRSHTRVTLRWSVINSAVLTDDQRRQILSRLGPVVSVTVDERRSQLQNRSVAEERLGEKVAGAFRRRKKRKATKPSAGAKRRRLADNRRRSERKAQRRPPRHDD